MPVVLHEPNSTLARVLFDLLADTDEDSIERARIIAGMLRDNEFREADIEGVRVELFALLLAEKAPSRFARKFTRVLEAHYSDVFV